jgi:hypothetical protein
MNCIAPEISEEITVFFEDQDLYAGAGQEIAQHHAGRAATDNAATSVQLFQVRSLSLTQAQAKIVTERQVAGYVLLLYPVTVKVLSSPSLCRKLFPQFS